MATKADDVYNAGLELDLDDRAVVAHRLLASLHVDGKPQPAVDDAWRAEISTRVDEVLDGTVALRSFEQMRAAARTMLDDLHR